MDGALLEQDTIRYDSLFGAITPIWNTAKVHNNLDTPKSHSF